MISLFQIFTQGPKHFSVFHKRIRYSYCPVLATEVFVFIYSIFMLVGLASSTVNTYSNYFGIFTAIIFFLEIVFLNFKERILRVILPLLGFYIFVVMVAFGLLYASDSTANILRSMQMIVLLTIVYAVVLITGRTVSITLGFCLSVIILAPIAFNQAGSLTGASRLYLQVAVGDESGLNPNGYGIILNLANLCALHLLYSRRRQPNFLFRASIILVSILTLFLSFYQIIFFLGSRQNQLWGLVTLTGLFFISTRGRFTLTRVFLSSFITVIAFIFALTFARESPHIDRVLNTIRLVLYDDATDLGGLTRINMIQRGIEMWLESPIFGFGVDGYRRYSGFRMYSHNMFVEILVNFGLIGFICFFYKYVNTFYFSLKLIRLRIPAIRCEAIWIILALVGIFVSHNFRPAIYEKSVFLFLGVLFGLHDFLKGYAIPATLRHRPTGLNSKSSNNV